MYAVHIETHQQEMCVEMDIKVDSVDRFRYVASSIHVCLHAELSPSQYVFV